MGSESSETRHFHSEDCQMLDGGYYREQNHSRNGGWMKGRGTALPRHHKEYKDKTNDKACIHNCCYDLCLEQLRHGRR